MPVSSRSQRAEAKYNVATEFPHLGLHSAASTGNIGLVKYALSHGQPINSVIDGVLPLHAACSGGNTLVVKLLIDSGADVNAPRLPRRYSPAAPRSSGSVPPGPIIGTSGSTPLHFAAANGHTAVARLLLQHGARPARPDKHGVTPEMLARRCGWIDCADAIAEFVREKDRDLRERETLLGLPDEYKDTKDNKECVCMWKRDRHGSTCSCETGDTRRLLHVKRSIDNVVHALKPSTPSTHTHSVSLSSASLLSGTTKRGPSPEDGTHSPHTPDSMRSAHSPSPSAFPPRRPSLPTDEVPRKSTSSRKKEKERRPSSAGTGASASPAGVRKLGSKYSLLNLFRRGSAEQEREQAEDGAADEFASDGRNASVESVRPGILRGHQRASSGPSTPNSQVLSTTNGSIGTGQGSGRALRFDNYNWDARSRSRSPGRPDINDGAFAEDDEFDDDDEDDDDDDEDEEEYGQPLPRATFGFGLRPRGQSMNSQLSRYSISADELAAGRAAFPFSIDGPPPDEQLARGRGRGDSMSSTGPSSGLPTPPAGAPALLYGGAGGALIASPGSMVRELPGDVSVSVSAPTKSPRKALDIDIRAISSHAQAEALVQRTQASILELGAEPADGGLLSARLAAYGESLAIERQLKAREMERRGSEGSVCTSANGSGSATGSGEATVTVSRAGESEVEGRPFGLRPKGRSASATLDRESMYAAAGAGGGRRRTATGSLSRSGSLGPQIVMDVPQEKKTGRSRTRRPHTSGSMSVNDEFMPASAESDHALHHHHHHHHHHHRSRSAAPPAIAIHRDPDSEEDDLARTSTHTGRTPPSPAPALSTARARTPDPGIEHAPIESAAPLCRVLSAPDRDRDVAFARANKLAKMGFAGADQPPQPQTAHVMRFGGKGLKSLVRTLKGKS